MDNNNKGYTPNLTDTKYKARTIKMLKKAFGFVMGYTHPTSSRELADDLLKQFLGRSNKPNGEWLRRTLLCKTDFYFKFDNSEQVEKGKRGYGKAQEYTRNEAGCDYVRQLLIDNCPEFAAKHANLNSEESKLVAVKSFVETEYNEELTNGTFKYAEGGNSDRKWHNLQGIKSDIRAAVLHDYGYSYDYDIKSCYTTLIVQYARKQGFIGKTPNLDEYSKNSHSFRIALANECGLLHDEAKMVITALFNGASLQINKDNSVFRQLGGSRKKMQALQGSLRLKALRSDIKKIWSHLKDEFEVGTTKSGRKERVSAKAKARLYFQLERMVLNALTEELDRMNVLHLDIHDGSMVNKKLDTAAIQEAIKQKTGYEIELVLKNDATKENKNNDTTTAKIIKLATPEGASRKSSTGRTSGQESKKAREGQEEQSGLGSQISSVYSECARQRVKSALAKFKGIGKAS